MKFHNILLPARWLWLGITMICLIGPWPAEATAPRVTAQLFGEAKPVAEIVSYQGSPLNPTSKQDEQLTMELITEAFKTVGKTPTVDILPSKQLATYALFNNEVLGLVGSPRDLTEKQTKQYRLTAFLLVGTGADEEVVALIVGIPRGAELSQAFNTGLQAIIKNGKYLEILEKYRGKGQVSADYFSRLKSHNPNWK